MKDWKTVQVLSAQISNILHTRLTRNARTYKDERFVPTEEQVKQPTPAQPREGGQSPGYSGE